MDGPHVDHGAAAVVRVHVLQGGLGGEECAVDVDRQHLLPVSKGIVLDWIDDLDAGVGHQDVDPPEGPRHAVGRAVHRIFTGDVHGHSDGLATRALDAGGHLLRGVQIHVGDGHRNTLAGQQLGDALADSAGRSGHDRRFTLQVHDSILCIKRNSQTQPSQIQS
jgi:hypothetical protein